MAVPTLDPIWRPNATGPSPAATQDRELIRTYLGWPATDAALQGVTIAMNQVAAVSPPAVAQIQAWINEIVDLEADHADQVADGTAHLGNAEEYEGPVPGTTPTRDEQLQTAGKLQWDTSLLKARYRFSGGAAASAGGQRLERIGLLRSRIISSLGLDPTAFTSTGGQGGAAMLLRS